MELRAIAHYRGEFSEKFGIPRQSGLADTSGLIVFEPEYSVLEAFRGIEQYSHLWIIWGFSAVEKRADFSPTVRPPKLGGNERVGVFATRSPFRPNSIGLSCVEFVSLEKTAGGIALAVRGADLMDNTPIYDVKPYLSYVDCKIGASGGFSDRFADSALKVNCDDKILAVIPKDSRNAFLQVLSLDPRPAYHDDPDRIYGFEFAGKSVRFTVQNGTLTVVSVE